MTRIEANPDGDFWAVIRDRIKNDLDQKIRDLREVGLMLEQSKTELNRLAQRNASINGQLQHVQSQIDSLPRADIRMAYDAALDAQQRLFLMRGQVDKLHSDQAHLSDFVAVLRDLTGELEGDAFGGRTRNATSSAAQIVEMLVQAQEGERQRLSRQMHDGPAQALSNFILQTEIAIRLFDIDQAKARAELESLKATSTTTFQKVRDFIFELRPMMLDDLGLLPTLKRYIEIMKGESRAEIKLDAYGKERRLEAYQEVMIFRAIQELLHNAAQHSEASAIKVQLDMGESLIKVVVEDDGRGFEAEKIDSGDGMGLKVIQDRVRMMGGSIEITSKPGSGARVKFELPVIERTAS